MTENVSTIAPTIALLFIEIDSSCTSARAPVYIVAKIAEIGITFLTNGISALANNIPDRVNAVSDDQPALSSFRTRSLY